MSAARRSHSGEGSVPTRPVLAMPMATRESWRRGPDECYATCDARSHVYERTTGLEIDECELSGCSRSVLDGLSPPRRASSGSWSAGCEARGKAQGLPVPSGGYRRGEDRTGELLEPSVDASSSGAPLDGMLWRGAGTGRCEAADAGWGGAPVRDEHRRPRGKRAPTPVAARACGTRKPRRGPGRVVR